MVQHICTDSSIEFDQALQSTVIISHVFLNLNDLIFVFSKYDLISVKKFFHSFGWKTITSGRLYAWFARLRMYHVIAITFLARIVYFPSTSVWSLLVDTVIMSKRR